MKVVNLIMHKTMCAYCDMYELLKHISNCEQAAYEWEVASFIPRQTPIYILHFVFHHALFLFCVQ